jgi:hypothetical protein
MAEPIVPPNAQVALVDEVQKPTTEWYRALKLLFDRFNASVSSSDAGIASKATKQQVWSDHSLIEFPENKAYRIVVKSAYAWTITEVTTRSTAGTCTLTVSINGTPLGGTANSVSTSEQSQAHASANAVAVGDDIELTVSANSGCENLSVGLSGTRTLA